MWVWRCGAFCFSFPVKLFVFVFWFFVALLEQCCVFVAFEFLHLSLLCWNSVVFLLLLKFCTFHWNIKASRCFLVLRVLPEDTKNKLFTCQHCEH